jgi:hypothetical protein
MSQLSKSGSQSAVVSHSAGYSEDWLDITQHTDGVDESPLPDMSRNGKHGCRLCCDTFRTLNSAKRHMQDTHVGLKERQFRFGLACQKGDAHTAKSLLTDVSHPIDINRICEGWKMDLVSGGEMKVMKLRLSPLSWACHNDHMPVVDLLLQNVVDIKAHNNMALKLAVREWNCSVINRLLQDERLDPTRLHTFRRYVFGDNELNQYPADALTDATLPRLAATLSLPFPANSCMTLWQPRLRQYRAQQIAFLEELIINVQWHRGGLCRDVMDHIVCEYLLGMKLRQFVDLNADRNGDMPTAGGQKRHRDE